MPRLTVDVGSDFDKVLTDLSTSKETTKAEIIRRAVASYTYLNKQVQDGKKVSITTQEDKVVKDVILP